MRKLTFTSHGLIRSISAISLIFLLGAQPLWARDLKDILKSSLVSDPALLEAKANENAAKSTTKATRAKHYPVVALTGTQLLRKNTNTTVTIWMTVSVCAVI